MKQTMFFEGIVCPMITPLNEDYSLDIISTQNLIQHIISGGVGGIFILGTTGEASSLSFRMKKELIQVCSEVLKQTNCQLLVGVGDTSLQQSQELARVARLNGADAVVANLPYYFDLDEKDVLNYFITLADTVSLPLFLYNYPKSTHFNITIETIRQLASHPNIIGIKDSSANLEYIEKVATVCRETGFNFLIGPEELLIESLKMGVHGGVNGGSNLFPNLFTELFLAAINKEDKKAKSLNAIVNKLSAEVYAKEGGANSYLKGLKAAASSLGLCKNILLPPLSAANNAVISDIENSIQVLKTQLKSI
jgi:4-hydroxy-tetrahydrodipicolinate synthase